jgi:hypothetical protein
MLQADRVLTEGDLTGYSISQIRKIATIAKESEEIGDEIAMEIYRQRIDQGFKAV